MTYKELGYDSFAERRTLPDLSPLETPNLTSLEGGDAIGGLLLGDGNTGLPITPGNVGDVMGDKAISFDKLDLVIGQGVNTVGMSGTGAESTSIRIWAGETFGNRGSAPFRVTAAGAVTASSISIIGGDVGGWVITPTTLYGLSSGTPTVAPNDGIVMTSGATANIRIYEDTEERIRLGNLAAGIYGLRGFATDGTTTIFELSDTLQQIAGWNFTNTVLRTGATDAASNVLIDSANSLMRLGPTTGNSITMDGANQRVRSSNYVAGVSGFTVEPLLIEAQNIVARGTMSGTVFRYDVINATGGRQIVANADALSTAMTALDASTLTTRGNVTLAVNDILIIRAQTALGIQEEYLRVTGIGAAPTYTVTRDLAGTFAADTNPIWPAGTPVVQLGVSDGAAAFSGGWLDLVGEASAGVDWPRLSVIQRTGVAYNAFTERVRVGNLNGYLGYAADTFGLGMGSSGAGEANITLDPTNGIRIRQGTTNRITLDMAGAATMFNLNIEGSLNIFTSGNIRSGQTAYDTGTGYFVEYNGGTPRLSLGVGGSTTANLTWDGTTLTVNGRTFGSEPVFGDGSDGAVTIAAPTTLTRDMFYTTLVVDAGITLNPGGFRIFASTSVTVNGTIARNGVNGTDGGNGGIDNGGIGGGGGSIATNLAAGSLFGAPTRTASGAGGNGAPLGGADGSPGVAGTIGTSTTSTIGSSGVAGTGNGGNGGANTVFGWNGGLGAAGAAGGTATASGTLPRSAATAVLMIDTGTTVQQLRPAAGAGGSGGGGGGASNNFGGRTGCGGGGAGSQGSSGGVVVIASPIITVAAAGAIRANGGIGGNGGAGGSATIDIGSGAGGGGGGCGGTGGNGGVLALFYTTYTNNGSVTVTGGTAGALGALGTGDPANGGQNGTNGVAGSAGSAGVIITLQLR